MAETNKAKQRRIKEGFFEQYCVGKSVIDIGCGRLQTFDGEDMICEHAFGWDSDNGDATFMEGVEDNTYDTVYASHILEHLKDPATAIMNWWRILKPGGHLIISVPHRDLYEKKRTLPSLWNGDHKFFLLPYECDPPNTFSFYKLILDAFRRMEETVFFKKFKVEKEGWFECPVHEHSSGEISIEAIIQKL
jgi:predicted SAM-dependent methyltransferase